MPNKTSRPQIVRAQGPCVDVKGYGVGERSTHQVLSVNPHARRLEVIRGEVAQKQSSAVRRQNGPWQAHERTQWCGGVSRWVGAAATPLQPALHQMPGVHVSKCPAHKREAATCAPARAFAAHMTAVRCMVPVPHREPSALAEISAVVLHPHRHRSSRIRDRHKKTENSCECGTQNHPSTSRVCARPLP